MDAIATGSVTEGEADRVSVWFPPDLYNIPPLTHTLTKSRVSASPPGGPSCLRQSLPTWAALTSPKHTETLSLMQRTEWKELDLPD